MRALLLFGLIASAFADEKPKPLFEDDFSKGAGRWQMTDANAWKVIKTKEGAALSQHKNSKYKPPYRSPLNIALVKDLTVGDFVLEAKCQSTARDYDHRDMCLFFGFQDPAHFCYVRLGMQATTTPERFSSSRTRTKISLTSTIGTNWDDEVTIASRSSAA